MMFVFQFFNHSYDSPLILVDPTSPEVKAVVISCTSKFRNLELVEGERLNFNIPVVSLTWNSHEPGIDSHK